MPEMKKMILPDKLRQHITVGCRMFGLTLPFVCTNQDVNEKQNSFKGQQLSPVAADPPRQNKHFKVHTLRSQKDTTQTGGFPDTRLHTHRGENKEWFMKPWTHTPSSGSHPSLRLRPTAVWVLVCVCLCVNLIQVYRLVWGHSWDFVHYGKRDGCG